MQSMDRESSTGLIYYPKIPRESSMSSTMKDNGGEACLMVSEHIKRSMVIYLQVFLRMG